MSLKRLRRKGWNIFAPVAILAVLSSGGTANAASYTVSEESEWEFTVSTTETVYIYGNSNRECNEPGTDPYLWLYNSSGTLVTQNDDGNHGAGQCVSSKIVTSLQPDTYTIRAGYCCSQRGLGNKPYSQYTYELVIQNYELTGSGTTTTTTTTTTPTTTTTTTSTTTTTTIPQTVGAPTNLSLTVDYTNGTVTADWDAPTDGTLSPERYAIGFGLNDEGNASPYAVATGNVGDDNALNTEYTFNASYLEAVFNEAHGLFNVKIRSDNDTNAVYSSWTSVSSVTIRNMPDSVDSTTATQVFDDGVSLSWVGSTDGFVAPSHYKVQYDQNGEVINEILNIAGTSYTIPYSDLSDGAWWFTVWSCGSEGDCNAGSTIEVDVFDEATWNASTTTTTTTSPPTTTTVPLVAQPSSPTPPITTTTTTTTTTTLPPPTTTLPPPPTTTTTTTTTTLPPTTTTTTLAPTTTTSPPTTSTIPPTTTTTSVPSTTTTTTVGSTTSTSPPTSTLPPTTTTTLRATTSSLPPTTTTVATPSGELEVVRVPIPENETRAPEVENSTPESKAKASEAIQFIADDELAGEVFTVVAAEEVTVDEVEELVSNENFDELPAEAKEAIAVALSDEPNEVKDTFEAEVNVFEGGFDEYVPADSKVPVKTRRVLVVATTAAFVLPSPRSRS